MIVCPSPCGPTTEPSTPGSPPRTRPSHRVDLHQGVDYRRITRYDVTAGYLDLPGLHRADPTPEEDT